VHRIPLAMATMTLPASQPTTFAQTVRQQFTHATATTRKETAGAATTDNTHEAKACVALVEEVFHPHEPQNEEKNGEAAFLPRLLDRMSFSMWSKAPAKSLDSEIQSLRGQQSAAAKLLEEIEKETHHINQRLHDKTQQAKLQPKQGFFGLACTNCGPSLDVNEINMQAGPSSRADTVELRPVLRSRIIECEQSLVERDAELRQLRHEVQLLRCEREMFRQDEKDAVLDGPGNARTSLIQRYGAAFSMVDGSQMKVAFLAWRQHVQQRALREKMLKRTSLALASDLTRLTALIFASWQTLVREKSQAQKLMQGRQRLTIGQSYAAKFASQADSTTMRGIVIQWWRVSKESALRTHVAAAQAQRDTAVKETRALMPLGSTQKQGAATDKACCSLM